MFTLVRGTIRQQHEGMETQSPRNARRLAAAILGAGVLSLIGFVFLSAASHQGALHARRAAFVAAGSGPAGDGGKVVRLDVEGMTCQGCAHSVESELCKVSGVAACRVDLDGHIAEVRLARADVPSDRLLAAVHDAGYEASLEPESPSSP
jgi:copper chaperone CopZ